MTFNSLKTWNLLSVDTENNSVNLPKRLFNSSVVTAGNYIYILGGYDPLSQDDISQKQVYFAKINSNGTISKWMPTTDLIKSVYASCAVTLGNYIYIMGGWNLTATDSEMLDNVYMAPINNNPSGSLGVWTPTTSLPNPIRYACALTYNLYIYILGGQNQNREILNTVYMAPINNERKVGAWTRTTNLPISIKNACAVISDNYIYIIGGISTDVSGINKYLNTVYRASIDNEGKVGEWTIMKQLPQPISDASAIISGKSIFVMGGNNNEPVNNILNTVYSAQINTNGTLNYWLELSKYTTNPLLQTLTSSCAITSGNYIYLIGGQFDERGIDISTSDNVYSAELTTTNLDAYIALQNEITTTATPTTIAPTTIAPTTATPTTAARKASSIKLANFLVDLIINISIIIGIIVVAIEIILIGIK